jgi:hypothetical protein
VTSRDRMCSRSLYRLQDARHLAHPSFNLRSESRGVEPSRVRIVASEPAYRRILDESQSPER